MAFGWLTLLKGVPWAGVISTAPLVAEGAKQLWKAVSKTDSLPEPTPATDRHSASPETGPIAALEARIFTLETGVDNLHTQMLKSSELIKVLADQNAMLIKRAEANRIRTLWLGGIAVLALIIAVASLAYAFMR